MKKTVIIILSAAFLFSGVYFIASGFNIRNDVVLCNFSDKGKDITVNVTVSSSAGYVRAVKNISQESNKAVLKFYSAFGGINGKIMRKSSFDISLEEETKEIYFYREDAPLLVLYKNEEGQWQRT